MNWSLITASNDAAVLKTCLASSPCVGHAHDFQVMRGFGCAGAAYNAGMRKAGAEVIVFAHQDVYLPCGWEEGLSKAVERLSDNDPDWGVLGVFGIARGLEPRGHIYCTGLQKVLGAPFDEPIECHSLDEVLLVIRRSSGLSFDAQLPGFHLYGTDICLEAQRRGLRSYIVSAFCLHNTEGMKFLPWAFWRGYFYLRHKWRDKLPIKTPCTSITASAWPVASSILRNAYAHYIKRERAGRRLPNPAALCGPGLSEQAASVAEPGRA